MSTVPALSPASRKRLTLAQMGYGATIVLLIGLKLLYPSAFSIGFQVMSLIPLFLPAIGIWQGKPYTHAWSGFIATLYLLTSLTHWWVHPEQRLATTLVIIAIGVWLFNSTYFARIRGRELGLGLKQRS